MNPRTTLILAAIAGLPAAASAQELFQVHYSWNEVLASGTGTVGSNMNSVVDPGEGARIRIGVTALINGTNAVGQTVNYFNPAPGGFGTVRGLGSVLYDLVGDNNNASAAGTWGLSLNGPFPPLTSGASPGVPQPGGASLHGIGGSQFVTPGSSAVSTNNNVQVGRSIWVPGSYAPRTVNFLARGSILIPTGEQNSILLAYGIGTDIDPINGLPFNYDLFVGKYLATDFGNGINIPIAPAPSSLALLSLGAAALRRSRKPHP